MKKPVLALMVSAIAFGGMLSTAQADTTIVTGGTVNFVGQVVDAACSVSADSVDQTVTLGQVRASKLTEAGMVVNQKEDFTIKLEDCDTQTSQNAAVIFNGQQDANQPGSLANTAGAGSATNVALQLYGPDGQALNIGESSSTVTLNDGENVIPLSVDYIATGTATAGNVTATATFSMVYS
ncbi:fimbrial protein BcfA [Salmonella enterica]|nr:fimbrial protein BcfA [Salmonella enterica]EEC0914014.1 fimbrial protein BcfA [Salmonella enterica subsp. enterica]EBQ6490355.1 fimbrial protein BcfA [Salmonella enterica]EEM0712478.1 fimbrial protein BcfA [Salmonella enterica]EFT8361839.1 fimbrial protein BcfA [Salmonella enterica]